MTAADVIAYGAVAVPGSVLLACALIGATRATVRLVRGALARWRQARADDPFWESDLHRCPICWDLAADEANGILRTDFELWSKEMESTP